MKERPAICIGIPCYQNAPAETLEDYMRFAYHLGRRYPEYDFFLAIKPKSEQFRARNAIMTAALQFDCDYVLMLDDDQVIEWEDEQHPSKKYDFLRTLIGHLERDPKLGLVGALYYHRGGDCLPVLMKQGVDGGYYYMRDDEIKSELQEVAVQGGGCMLIRMDAALRVPQPWFKPEYQYGTDIQICQALRDAGYRIACDTSIVLGHVLTRREVVTPANRLRIMAESASGGSADQGQFDPRWTSGSAYQLYYLDALEYLGIKDHAEIETLAVTYDERIKTEWPGRDGDLEAYYRARGKAQLARQVVFHGSPVGINNDGVILSLFKATSKSLHVLDFGCGSAPVGFELALKGHRVDFVDLDGAEAYEFTKWRAQKRDLNGNAGWTVGGPYDVVLCLDSLEHLKDPIPRALDLVDRLVPNGVLVTNYFSLRDTGNQEHISMDREAMRKALVGAGVYPVHVAVWVKRDIGFMDRREAA